MGLLTPEFNKRPFAFSCSWARFWRIGWLWRIISGFQPKRGSNGQLEAKRPPFGQDGPGEGDESTLIKDPDEDLR
jgi:hypothetical protein